MIEAEEAFAAQLARDLERVLGAGVAIDDIEIGPNGAARVRASILAEGRIETIEVEAPSVREACPLLIQRAAELRLAGAWTRMITLT